MSAKRLHIRSPLIESTLMSQRTGFKVYLKLENTQPSASFKIRGIGHAIQKAISRGCKQFVISSGGNAGLAAAYAARQMNVPLTVYIPESTPLFVKSRLEAEGSTVIIAGSVWDHADAKAREHAKLPNVEYLHPFDHPDVWEGHASMMTEVAEDLDSTPDLVVSAVGGGGLLCGIVQGMEQVGWDQVPILGMETIGADSYNQAVKAGKLVTLPDITSVAKCLGALTVAEKSLDYFTTRSIISEVITDKECVDACLKFLDEHRMLVEPACGAPLAAVYAGVIERLVKEKKLTNIRSVVVVVCGGGSLMLEHMLALKDKFNL